MLNLSVNKYPSVSLLLDNKNNYLVHRSLLKFNYLFSFVIIQNYYANYGFSIYYFLTALY